VEVLDGEAHDRIGSPQRETGGRYDGLAPDSVCYAWALSRLDSPTMTWSGILLGDYFAQ